MRPKYKYHYSSYEGDIDVELIVCICSKAEADAMVRDRFPNDCFTFEYREKVVYKNTIAFSESAYRKYVKGFNDKE